MPRTNFTDAQKAEIYVRDRATCAFSGANLWLLDSGASGQYLIDWADHVKPASGGGASAIDNGICASWPYNYAKSDSPYPGVQLFARGLPTPDFFFLERQLTPEIAGRIIRFSKLHSSDWSFNRAIWLVCLGLCCHSDSRRGATRSRDDCYYAKAALKRICAWRALVERDSVASLEKRFLTPKSLQEDHRLLLSVRKATSTDEILAIMKLLLQFHIANQSAFEAFMRQLYEETTESSDSAFLRRLQNDPAVTAVVGKRLLASARLIFP